MVGEGLSVQKNIPGNRTFEKTGFVSVKAFRHITAPRPSDIYYNFGSVFIGLTAHTVDCQHPSHTFLVLQQLESFDVIESGCSVLAGPPEYLNKKTLRIGHKSVIPNSSSLQPLRIYRRKDLPGLMSVNHTARRKISVGANTLIALARKEIIGPENSAQNKRAA
jgi:hypothetical protein